MPVFAANVSILFPDLPFLRRFEAAREAGFDAVEVWWPAPGSREMLAPSQFAERVRASGLEVVLINFDAGDIPAGDRGLAGDPQRVTQFRENVPAALELARFLGCEKLKALASNAALNQPRERLLELLVENIAFAADAAQRQGMSIMLEALNPVDTPRYLLQGTSDVLELIRRVARPNVRYQLDVYHVAMAGEDPLQAIPRARGMIGHVQFADVPGRHEPGTGRLPFDAILTALPENGYHGPIGLEYVPSNPSARDFSFLSRWKAAQSEEVAR